MHTNDLNVMRVILKLRVGKGYDASTYNTWYLAMDKVARLQWPQFAN